MISEFSQNLTLWINRHMDELQMTKAQIFDGIPWENATIELLDKRIDLQIENLQKIVL